MTREQVIQEMTEKYEELAEQILGETTYRIEIQREFSQVGVWCETFNKSWLICYQNGNMSYEPDFGTPEFNNPGANSGVDDLSKILRVRPEFSEFNQEQLRDIIYEVMLKILNAEPSISGAIKIFEIERNGIEEED